MKNIFISISALLLFSCTNQNSPTTQEANTPLSPSEKAYWYNNQAEITSYDLTQARYGELHKGTAVMVFVTEPYSEELNVKPNNSSNTDIPCLKLNFTKKFNTGVYPYSMMTSSFFPFDNGIYSEKVSTTSQEWCGHTFTDVKNTYGGFKIKTNSYFEGESGSVKLDKNYLEDDFWSMIRLFPNELPTGDLQIIPSMFYLRLAHKETKAYQCSVSKKVETNKTELNFNYPELNRTLSITYSNTFPYSIESWNETYVSGWGESKKELTTTAIKKKTILSDYWNRHNPEDTVLRDSLGLN